MTATQNIAGLIPTGHAFAVLGNTLPSKGKKKKSLVKTGVTTLVGTAMLPSIAQLANSV